MFFLQLKSPFQFASKMCPTALTEGAERDPHDPSSSPQTTVKDETTKIVQEEETEDDDQKPSNTTGVLEGFW